VSVSYNGQCYASPSDASDAFLRDFPHYNYGATATEWNVISYAKSATGIVYTMKSTDALTGVATTLPIDTLNFNACTPTDLSMYPMQDMIFYLALVVIWAFGFQSGQHR